MPKTEKQTLYFYEVLVRPVETGSFQGQRGWLDLSYWAPMRRALWVDDFTPLYGAHPLRLLGPGDTLDRRGKRQHIPGDIFVTRKPLDRALTEEHAKNYTVPAYQGAGVLNKQRIRLSKVVAPKVRLLADEEITMELRARAISPEGEGFGFGRRIGGEHATWNPVLFEDHLSDAVLPAEHAAFLGMAQSALQGTDARDNMDVTPPEPAA